MIVPLVTEHVIRQGSKILRPPTNTREASGAPRKVLDREFLLKHCYGRAPSDLCVCNVSSKELQDVSRMHYGHRLTTEEVGHEFLIKVHLPSTSIYAPTAQVNLLSQQK